MGALKACLVLRPDRVPLSGLLGRAVLSGLLSSDGVLHGSCLRAHRNSLFGALQRGVSGGAMGLRGLGIGDGLHAVGIPALLGVGLLELPLGGQRIVAGHGAGNFFRLTLDRVDQTLTCLVSLVVLSHLSLLLQFCSSQFRLMSCSASAASRFSMAVTAPARSLWFCS